jgi:CRP-like cAMP-binding protein
MLWRRPPERQEMINNQIEPVNSANAAGNLLLKAMPRQGYSRLAPGMKRITLEYGKTLHQPGQAIHNVYFPITCLISVTITMQDGRTVECGAVGSREMVGVNAFMGGRETTLTKYIVQVPGDAIKLNAAPLLLEFDQNKDLRDVMLRYTQAFIAQISQNAACNRLHTIEQRLARWLLEVRDRLNSDELRLTHEFIAEMLGVIRPGVTIAANALQEKGIIKYSRGRIGILDGQQLEKISCECYEDLKGEYDRLLGIRPE